LLAGFYPGDSTEQKAAQKLTALLDAGIRSVVNLMEEDEQNYNDQPFRQYEKSLMTLAAERSLEISYKRIPIIDRDIPSVATMQTILDTLDSALARDLATYVHCWGGIGRTGTVVGCYLAQNGIALGDDATSHRPSPENERQRALIRQWQHGQ
jgi:protein-tyrosine phosphatase